MQALFLYLKETEGVGAFPILPDLEVQVVTGGISGGADVADHLALLHFLPNRYADGGTMGVQGIEGIVVVYLDVVPIPAAHESMALAMVTVPSAAARMGVPSGAAMSVPLW